MALVWTCAAAAAHGHGITADRVDGGAGVRAVYDDGTPVTFSEARLFAPGKEDKPVLTGTTDRDGCFMFRPDTNGVWRVTIDDGMGHAVTKDLQLDGQVIAHKPERDRMPKRYGIVTGLALIFGVFGWFAFLRLKLSGRAGK